MRLNLDNAMQLCINHIYNKKLSTQPCGVSQITIMVLKVILHDFVNRGRSNKYMSVCQKPFTLQCKIPHFISHVESVETLYLCI